MLLCYTWGTVFVDLCTLVVHFLFRIPERTNELLPATFLQQYSHFADGKTEAEELSKEIR